MNYEQYYFDLFTTYRDAIYRQSSKTMNAHRERACNVFLNKGFPNRKTEDFKYTDIASLFSPNYNLNIDRIDIHDDLNKAFQCGIPGLDTLPFLIYNSTFFASLQAKRQTTDGITVCSLTEAEYLFPTLLAKYYSKIADTTNDSITALNTMFAQEGLFIYVSRDVKATRWIQIISNLSSNEPLMTNRRVLIVLESGAKVGLLFCDHALNNIPSLVTQVAEVFVSEGSYLDICHIEETNNSNITIRNLYIQQSKDSKVHHTSLCLHNGISRNTTQVTLNGSDAECQLNGCAIENEKQHVDNNTLIVHRAKGCTSEELYKYVLGGDAIGAFAGRILVEPTAQKASSNMCNRNICVSDSAHMYTQPMLEIYADDVRCSHGCTVGRLDDHAIFYMCQRGIHPQEAKLLLETAFINEVINTIHLAPLRNRLQLLAERRLRNGLNKCAGCRLC